MTLAFWIAAEKWFEFWAPLSLGLIMFIALVMSFAVTKRKTLIGRRILQTSVLLIGILAIVLFINNHRFSTYLDSAEHVTPVIRHMHYKAFQGYQPMARSTIDTYARYHDPEGVMATGLYTEEVVTENVNYLGKKHRHHYFEHEGTIFKQYESSVIFDSSQNETAIIGTLYHLKNPEFKSIGFQDTHFIFYDKVVIAEEDIGKEYEPEDEFLIPTLKDIFLEWTFRYY